MHVEFAPQLRKRAQLQLNREKLAHRRGERKVLCVGSYNQPEDDVITGYHPQREILTRDGRSVTLKGYEVFLYDTAHELLKIKPDASVVMFDVGGGAGSTWNRLALTMQKEVED